MTQCDCVKMGIIGQKDIKNTRPDKDCVKTKQKP